MKKIIFVCSILISGIGFSAGIVKNAKIKTVATGPFYDSLCNSESCVFITLDGSISTKPTCNTSEAHFVLDASTSAGKNHLSVILSAFMTGKYVTISGTGACTHYQNTEDFRYIYFN